MATREEPFDAPLLIVVTGPPATGKSTVAVELASRLCVPIISKDTLKERLYETFGSGDELEGRVEQAALALLFSVVESQLEAGVSVVAESNFDAHSDTRPFRRLGEEYDVRLVQIHCQAGREQIERKFAERSASGSRHPGHDDDPEDAQEVGEKLETGEWDALDLPAKLIELPVLDGDIDYAELARRVREVAYAA